MTVIGVRHGDGLVWHAPSLGAGPDYDTACSCDANDPNGADTHGTVKAPRGQKITCPQCYQLWRSVLALGLKESHFAHEAKK